MTMQSQTKERYKEKENYQVSPSPILLEPKSMVDQAWPGWKEVHKKVFHYLDDHDSIGGRWNRNMNPYGNRLPIRFL